MSAFFLFSSLSFFLSSARHVFERAEETRVEFSRMKEEKGRKMLTCDGSPATVPVYKNVAVRTYGEAISRSNNNRI